MANILRFPRGNDVVVCKKEDILATIDDNILDKELAYALIEELEITADKFLSEGKWVGIPFLGNIRKNKYREKLHSKETKELIDYGKRWKRLLRSNIDRRSNFCNTSYLWNLCMAFVQQDS